MCMRETGNIRRSQWVLRGFKREIKIKQDSYMESHLMEGIFTILTEKRSLTRSRLKTK